MEELKKVMEKRALRKEGGESGGVRWWERSERRRSGEWARLKSWSSDSKSQAFLSASFGPALEIRLWPAAITPSFLTPPHRGDPMIPASEPPSADALNQQTPKPSLCTLLLDRAMLSARRCLSRLFRAGTACAAAKVRLHQSLRVVRRAATQVAWKGRGNCVLTFRACVDTPCPFLVSALGFAAAQVFRIRLRRIASAKDSLPFPIIEINPCSS